MTFVSLTVSYKHCPLLTLIHHMFKSEKKLSLGKKIFLLRERMLSLIYPFDYRRGIS